MERNNAAHDFRTFPNVFLISLSGYETALKDKAIDKFIMCFNNKFLVTVAEKIYKSFIM